MKTHWPRYICRENVLFADMVVAYPLGGRLGHGMWSSVVGWIFGTVESHLKNESTDGRKMDTITTTTTRYAGRDDLCPKFDQRVLLQTRMLPSELHASMNDIDH